MLFETQLVLYNMGRKGCTPDCLCIGNGVPPQFRPKRLINVFFSFFLCCSCSRRSLPEAATTAVSSSCYEEKKEDQELPARQLDRVGSIIHVVSLERWALSAAQIGSGRNFFVFVFFKLAPELIAIISTG